MLENLLLNKGIDVNSLEFLIDHYNLLYNKSKAYIDYVELEIGSIKVGFENFSHLTEEDEIVFAMKNLVTGEYKEIRWEASQCYSPSLFKIKGDKEAYEFSILVNRKLAYLGVFEKQEDIPF